MYILKEQDKKKYSRSSNIHKHRDAPLECSHDRLLAVAAPPPLLLPPPHRHRRRRLPLPSDHHGPLPKNRSWLPPPPPGRLRDREQQQRGRSGWEHQRVPPGPSPRGGRRRRVLPGGLRDGVQDGRGVPAAPGSVQGHGRAGGGGLLPAVVRQLQVHREALHAPLQGLRRRRRPRRLPQAQRDRRVRRAVGGGGTAADQGRAAVPLLQGRRAGGVVRDEGQGEDHRRHREVHLA